MTSYIYQKRHDFTYPNLKKVLDKEQTIAVLMRDFKVSRETAERAYENRHETARVIFARAREARLEACTDHPDAF